MRLLVLWGPATCLCTKYWSFHEMQGSAPCCPSAGWSQGLSPLLGSEGTLRPCSDSWRLFQVQTDQKKTSSLLALKPCCKVLNKSARPTRSHLLVEELWRQCMIHMAGPPLRPAPVIRKCSSVMAVGLRTGRSAALP